MSILNEAYREAEDIHNATQEAFKAFDAHEAAQGYGTLTRDRDERWYELLRACHDANRAKTGYRDYNSDSWDKVQYGLKLRAPEKSRLQDSVYYQPIMDAAHVGDMAAVEAMLVDAGIRA